MTSSVSNPSEIEDVLSSIRRLVADDGSAGKAPAAARPPKVQPGPVDPVEDPSAFVLTTDQRVEAEVAELRPSKPDVPQPAEPAAELAPTDTPEQANAVWTAEDFLNAKLQADAEVGDIGLAREGDAPAAEAEADPTDTAQAAEREADPAPPEPTPESAEADLEVAETDQGAVESNDNDADDGARTADEKGMSVEEDPDLRGPIEHDYQTPAFAHVNIDALEPSEFEKELDRSLDADIVPPIAMADPLAQLDEDMLKEIVADQVRKELQGAMGEKITRNVRKLVRREIQRALASQDLN